MHFTLPLLLSLLSSTALALPTTTTPSNTTSTFEKRKTGWIGAFQNPGCTGPPAPGQVALGGYHDCVKWSPVGGTQYIGISYGSGPQHKYEVTFYADDNCKHVLNGLASFVRQNDDHVWMGCTNQNQATKSFMVAGDIPDN